MSNLHRLGAERPVLITGGAGFLGSNLADRLARGGVPVRIFDSLARPQVERNLAWLKQRHNGLVSAYVADVRDTGAVAEAIQDAAAVFHLAAQVAVTTSLEDPISDFEINARGTLNLLEAVRQQSDRPPLLFASTNKIYGKLLADEALERVGERWRPRGAAMARGCGEDTPLDFYSPYGCSKGVADQYVLDYGRVFGLQTAVLRMSCLYGPRQFGTEDQGWIAHFALQTLRNRPITIYGDGLQVRDALFVDDAVDAWLAAWRQFDRVCGRAFNLGGGPERSLSLRELLARLQELTGSIPRVEFQDARPGDQLWYVTDNTALTAATGWMPRTGLDDGLECLVAWLATQVVERTPTRVSVPA
jgi:CDP-paratose 2-epimerase